MNVNLRRIPALAIAIFWVTAATAQEFGSEARPKIKMAPATGVRHQINASIRTAGHSPHAHGHVMAIRLHVQVSDHAPDLSFYGIVKAEFTDFNPLKGSPEKTVWEDSRCHRERGLPKLTPVAVDGEIETATGRRIITARIRRRGLRMPSDEIIIRKDLRVEDSHTAMAIRSETSASGLLIGLRLLQYRCLL